MGGGQRHRRTLFGILLPLLYVSELRHVLCSALFAGNVKSRGRWFGSAHCGGSEPSDCVGGMKDAGWGGRLGEEGWKCRMPQTSLERLNAFENEILIKSKKIKVCKVSA